MDLTPRQERLLTILAVLLIIFLAIQVTAMLVEALLRVVDVLLIFVAAWSLAYLLAPIVDRLEGRTPLRRVGSVIVVYIGLGLVLAGTLALAVPTLVRQLASLVERAPEFGAQAAVALAGLESGLARLGVRADLGEIYATLPERVGEVTGAIAGDALGFLAATGALLFNVTLVLIIAFLMLIDGGAMWRRFTVALPDGIRGEAELFRQSADRSFGGFLRGSLLLAVIYGTGTALTLAPLGIPFAGVLAVFAGLAMIIPFFGPFIALVPVLLITILGAPDRFLIVLVLTLVLQQLVLNVIGPRVMASAIGIHPLFVFLALLLGSRIAGFWGVLLAMPVAGIINTFARYAYAVGQGRRRADAALIVSGPGPVPAEGEAERVEGPPARTITEATDNV